MVMLAGLPVTGDRVERPSGIHAIDGLAVPVPVSRLTSETVRPASIDWPSIRRVLVIQDYNTAVVLAGVTLLGLAAGLVGSFTLLRKRSLMGDALSHAALPGVCVAFLLAQAAGMNPRSLPVLLAGAAVSGTAGVAVILFIRRFTRLKEDAALGIVLSVFFGAGVSLLTLIQQLPAGAKAGLDSFIFGQTASMLARDAWLIAGVAAVTVVAVGVLFKELTLLCFDEAFAGAQGFRVLTLDLLLMGLVMLVTLIGLQAVGLVLMIALLVIPAAAARFWTEDLRRMTIISAMIGSGSAFPGALLSALIPRLPSGAVIVLMCSSLFFFSLLFGSARGVVLRASRRQQLNDAIDRQHLLRALFELIETAGDTDAVTPVDRVSLAALLEHRTWTISRLRRQIGRLIRAGLVWRHLDGQLSLTAAGVAEAARLVHEHRLWELYLITRADVAPARVDRSADAIEHVLEPELIHRLELLLQSQRGETGVANSPHPLSSGAAS
jgi:manganese/zinc/iron transport system permease protein